MAADQRTKLRAARDGAGLPSDDPTLLDVKLDIVRALAPHAPAMLLDPEIALAAGAAGFIAGRSIWKESAGMDGEERSTFLRGEARRRLSELLEMVA